MLLMGYLRVCVCMGAGVCEGFRCNVLMGLDLGRFVLEIRRQYYTAIAMRPTMQGANAAPCSEGRKFPRDNFPSYYMCSVTLRAMEYPTELDVTNRQPS